ncbi:hypothetical protein A9Q87_05270 [Flavobacteriales bacterium 34_180_T64]|nr:hypothetical protein A9Q87_05270 [Flavobacteriales bacterium 34_180_T64]
MKLKYILPILFIALMSTSCSTDESNDDPQIVNEVDGLIRIHDIINDTHTIELYSKTGNFSTGYNAISMRLMDNTTNLYVEDASITWLPMMQMPTMQHSSPRSSIAKSLGKDTVYEGYIVYQMTGMDGSGWSLTIDYSIADMVYTATESITVTQAENQNVTSFMADDGSNYVIAMIEPSAPKIAINNLKVGLFRMESMMSFPIVEDYTIALDPRMPGMDNHTSSNNTDLSYSAADTMYHADLSLTMTGYWVLNLKLLNTMDEVLKGEDVTDDNNQSSLYLELEF